MIYFLKIIFSLIWKKLFLVQEIIVCWFIFLQMILMFGKDFQHLYIIPHYYANCADFLDKTELILTQAIDCTWIITAPSVTGTITIKFHELQVSLWPHQLGNKFTKYICTLYILLFLPRTKCYSKSPMDRCQIVLWSHLALQNWTFKGKVCSSLWFCFSLQNLTRPNKFGP